MGFIATLPDGRQIYIFAYDVYEDDDDDFQEPAAPTSPPPPDISE